MRLLAFVFIAPSLCAVPCTPVDRDRILAEDVAVLVAPFGQLAPDLVVGMTPLPGVRRTFSGHELAAIAQRNHIQLEGSLNAVCFERRVTPLTVERILEAMKEGLRKAGSAGNAIHIEVVDFIRQSIPSGELTFPRSGLTSPSTANSDAPVFWRGVVRYGSRNTLSIWASVRIHEERPIVISVRQIKYGTVILPEDVEVAKRDLFPLTPHLEALSEVLGRTARKTLPAGVPITSDVLDVPLDIVTGDLVRIVAKDGSASIMFEAIARSPGRKGDRILLLNPESHRNFRAYIDGKGSAHIVAGF